MELKNIIIFWKRFENGRGNTRLVAPVEKKGLVTGGFFERKVGPKG